MNIKHIKEILGEEWGSLMQQQFQMRYMYDLSEFVRQERRKHVIYPSTEEVFTVFKDLQPSNINVVILGQDPYHDGRYHKMAFSNREDAKVSPSLRNIFKEIEQEYGERPHSTDLKFWQQQGVFLVNTILTVRKGEPLSHSGMGWERFISACLRALSTEYHHNVYMLWGLNAQNFARYINGEHNLILKSAHPSPLSARKWFGNNHFRLANEYLKEKKNIEINWI